MKEMIVLKIEEIEIPETVKKKCKRVYKVYGHTPEFESEQEREAVMERVLFNIVNGFEILRELHNK